MVHVVDDFEIKFTSRRSWKAEIRKSGVLVATAPVTWSSATSKTRAGTFQKVWFANPAELEDRRNSRSSFIVAVASAKHPKQRPSVFHKFESVLEVRATGKLAGERCIETRVLSRLAGRDFEPTKTSVLAKIKEYDRLKGDAFLARYARNVPSRSHYLVVNGKPYPLKAVWAAAHTPNIPPREFNTTAAVAGLQKLGFADIIDDTLAAEFDEGERLVRETTVLSRNSKLVKRAKAYYKPNCVVCGFNFGKAYGAIGEGYIECHHLDPLSGRAGRRTPTKIQEVTVLCSNCHRMIHSRRDALKIDELKQAMKEAAERRSPTALERSRHKTKVTAAMTRRRTVNKSKHDLTRRISA